MPYLGRGNPLLLGDSSADVDGGNIFLSGVGIDKVYMPP